MPKKKSKDTKPGLLTLVATGVSNSSFAFYWSFVGVVIQFFHVSMAIAGTFGVFQSDVPVFLLIGEWILIITFAGFFSATLLYFTLKSGTVKVETKRKEEKRKEAKKQKEKYNWIVRIFLLFDIVVAYFFWMFVVFMQTTIFEVSTQEIVNSMQDNLMLSVFIFAVVIMHPLTLVFYAKEVDLKRFVKKE